MDLGDWHPRDIPEALLSNPALQKQQGFTLPPLEQWFVMLLHEGTLPGALANRPNTAFTKSLLDDAKERIPRLKWDLTEVGLRNFLIDEETIGIPCTKYRASYWQWLVLCALRRNFEKLGLAVMAQLSGIIQKAKEWRRMSGTSEVEG